MVIVNSAQLDQRAPTGASDLGMHTLIWLSVFYKKKNLKIRGVHLKMTSHYVIFFLFIIWSSECS